MKIAVMGGESTGGRLVARLLSVDPGLDVIHRSLPHGARTEVGTHWPFTEVATWRPDRVLVTVRDWDTSLRSKRLHHQPMRVLAEDEHRHAYEQLFMWVRLEGWRWRFVVYESLVAAPHEAMENLWAWLGRDPQPLSEEVYDGNLAYRTSEV